QWRRSLTDAIPRQHMFNTLTQHRWPFNSAVQGDKRCRYAAGRHRAKTLATSSVTVKVSFVARIAKTEHAGRSLVGRNDEGFHSAPVQGRCDAVCGALVWSLSDQLSRP